MTHILKFKYTDSGYCRVVFQLESKSDKEGALYCIMEGEGMYSLTPEWHEPCSPISNEETLKKCRFEKVPCDGSNFTTIYANEFIEKHTAGFM